MAKSDTLSNKANWIYVTGIAYARHNITISIMLLIIVQLVIMLLVIKYIFL
jgi:hypothetical protein